MTSQPCMRCGQHWACNSGCGFDAITKFCPDCIPLVLPKMGGMSERQRRELKRARRDKVAHVPATGMVSR